LPENCVVLVREIFLAFYSGITKSWRNRAAVEKKAQDFSIVS